MPPAPGAGPRTPPPPPGSPVEPPRGRPPRLPAPTPPDPPRRRPGWIGQAVTLTALAVVAAAAILVWGWGADPAVEEAKERIPQPVDLDPRRPEALLEPTPMTEPEGEVLVEQRLTEAELDDNTVLPPEEFDLLVEGGLVQADFHITRDPETDTTTGLSLFTVSTEHDPADLLAEITGLYRGAGYRSTPAEHDNVRLQVLDDPAITEQVTYRAHYLVGHRVVRVEAYGTDRTAVADRFTTLLDRQCQDFPADDPQAG
ncbi:hypothetical protein [Actinoalloteichus caeruleus]|uniref:Uncharacterized protein n=3 Tax=Pseudonocardiaceae TaxID=2070 RepID=A0ABT1JK69_ACTCY|nr:hypothetical protein [Actinoalloteichus caeruleus]MCP2332900.1 hypothetical protein [Actinoalloteichus caeruleus DSM 43889]